MRLDARSAGVALAGFATFINLYTPQAILPAIAGDFAAGPAVASLAVTATLLAVALAAPFVGAVSDALGRKRLITMASFSLAAPALLIALSPDIPTVIALRFVQGLLFPFIFTVTVAYIGDEVSGAAGIRAASAYALGTIFGGFLGRFIAGIATDIAGWRAGFAVVGALSLLCAIAIAALLPKERNFRPVAAGWAVWRMHLRNPALRATCAIGASMLFSMVASFTYANFRLAEAPYSLTPGQQGWVFTVYLLGLATTPIGTRLTIRYGRLPTLIAGVALAMAGSSLTLLENLSAIIAGLALLAGGMFVVQTLSLGYIAAHVPRAKSTAVGLYVTTYYVGGALGGILPAPLWRAVGWPGVVGLVWLAATNILILAMFAWKKSSVFTGR